MKKKDQNAYSTVTTTCIEELMQATVKLAPLFAKESKECYVSSLKQKIFLFKPSALLHSPLPCPPITPVFKSTTSNVVYRSLRAECVIF